MASSEVCMDCAPPPDQQTQTQYNPMDPSTFVAPTPCAPHSIIIEFCDRVSAPHQVASLMPNG
jgi:hypothetical protein